METLPAMRLYRANAPATWCACVMECPTKHRVSRPEHPPPLACQDTASLKIAAASRALTLTNVHEQGPVAKAQADAQPLRNALASVEAPERFAAQADYSPEISANVRSRSVSRSITPSRATSTNLRVILSFSSRALCGSIPRSSWLSSVQTDL